MGLDKPTVDAVMADWRTAPIPERLRAMLGFLEELTLRPTDVNADDVRAVRAAGVSDRAIEEAIYVCFLFNALDRLADALDFQLPEGKAHDTLATLLYRLGYGVAKLPG